MPSFSHRSAKKELLDGEGIATADLYRNLQELEFINRHLGGHRITIEGLKYFLRRHQAPSYHVVEIGSGGGDNLAAIQQWCHQKGISVQLTGIDINPDCISYARQHHPQVHWIGADYRTVKFDRKPDVIFSSLFSHHFSDDEVAQLMLWMRNHSALGFFINDLHRHPLAYYSIRILTLLFSKSHLVKNDAPLSVLRSFRKSDWQRLSAAAGVPITVCGWRWTFRWLVISSAHASN